MIAYDKSDNAQTKIKVITHCILATVKKIKALLY